MIEMKFVVFESEISQKPKRSQRKGNYRRHNVLEEPARVEHCTVAAQSYDKIEFIRRIICHFRRPVLEEILERGGLPNEAWGVESFRVFELGVYIYGDAVGPPVSRRSHEPVDEIPCEVDKRVITSFRHDQDRSGVGPNVGLAQFFRELAHTGRGFYEARV